MGAQQCKGAAEPEISETVDAVSLTATADVSRESKEVQTGEGDVEAHRPPSFHHAHIKKYDRECDKKHHVHVMFNPDDYMYAKVEHGKYVVSTLCLFPDVSPKPPHLVIKNFKWTSAPQNGGGHGQLTLPEDFDGNVPVCVATDDYLEWFGCRFAHHLTDMVDLKADHEIMDFDYEDYKEKWVLNPKLGAGSLGLETHEFIHLECPLSHHSGHFLLGRINKEEDELYICAFHIPAFHTVFVAPFAIHSNDHQEGVWRTMLSAFSKEDSEAGRNYIDHVLLKRPSGKNVDLKFLRPNKLRITESGTVQGAVGHVGAVKKATTAAKGSCLKMFHTMEEKVWEVEDSYAERVKKLPHGIPQKHHAT